MTATLPLSAHKQLSQRVAERLRTAILEGQLRPGQWLRQERIAGENGVSQMAVREALKQLAAEGLVEHVSYRGVRPECAPGAASWRALRLARRA